MSVTGPPITGHCLCGAVRFELTTEPLSAGYCHCTRCQRRTGAAASAQARFPAGALQVTAGEEHVRTWQPEQGFAKLFCGICGGALFSHDPGQAHWAVRLGALDPGHGIRPTFRQRVESACEWVPCPTSGWRASTAGARRTTCRPRHVVRLARLVAARRLQGARLRWLGVRG